MTAILAGAFLAALCVSFLLYRRSAGEELEWRILSSVLPIGYFFLAAAAAQKIFSAPQFIYNECRLAPLFGLLYGYKLYYPLEQGPVMATMYAPMAFLSYFPTLFARTPVPAILCGSLVASLYYFVPAWWVIVARRRHTPERVAGLFIFLLFGLWTVNSLALIYSGFGIHADAPALAFGAVACALLSRDDQAPYSLWRLCGAALATSLAILSKQNMISVPFCIALFLLISGGLWTAIRYLVLFGLMFASCVAIFCALWTPGALFFNLYQVPSRHPFEDFAGSFGRFWPESMWYLFLFGVLAVMAVRTDNLHWRTARKWVRENRWIVFCFVALGGIPLAIAAGAKSGGDKNNFSPFFYFALLGVCLFLARFLARGDTLGRSVRACALLLMCLAAPASIFRVAHVSSYFHSAWNSPPELAYRYELNHPGQVYFPWHPLAVLFAEGRLYHIDAGLDGRVLAGAAPSKEHFFRYVPAGMKYVAREDDSPSAAYLKEFNCRTHLAELGSIPLMARSGDCPAAGTAPPASLP